jgi:hypothetical protein
MTTNNVPGGSCCLIAGFCYNPEHLILPLPGIERQPLKKLDPDAPTLLKLLQRWRALVRTDRSAV